MSNPLVSVVCVTMNHENYVAQGFNSIVNQTYKNIEVLYVDNHSTDNTFEIADSIFRNSGLPYQGFRRERSYNLPENLNFLVKKAKGDYLFLISGDDWTLENCIGGMVSHYEANPHYGLVYGNGWYYYEDTQKLQPAANHKFISGHLFDHIFLYGVLFPVGVMVKKETFAHVGLYDETTPIEDYDFWLRVAKEYQIGYYDVPTIIYRKHSLGMTGLSGYKNIPFYLQIAEKYKTNKLYKKVKRQLRQFTIYENILKKNRTKALALLLKDFRLERFYLSALGKLITGIK